MPLAASLGVCRFNQKVLFLGAPSTGKTTLVSTLAERLQTAWMPEYGHTYWHENQVNRRLTPEQLLTIAETHLELENQLLLESNRFLFVDTSALTTYHFALDYHGSALPELERLAALSERRYGYVFLCGDDIPYEDPGTDPARRTGRVSAKTQAAGPGQAGHRLYGAVG